MRLAVSAEPVGDLVNVRMFLVDEDEGRVLGAQTGHKQRLDVAAGAKVEQRHCVGWRAEERGGWKSAGGTARVLRGGGAARRVGERVGGCRGAAAVEQREGGRAV